MALVFKLISFLAASRVVLLVESRTPCPHPSEGCDCTNVGYVYCSGTTDIPANLPASTVFLNLDSNPIGTELLRYQMDNLNSIQLEQLYLSGTGLEVIENRAFANQSNLRTLDLSMNNFRILNDQMFYGLEQLETLFLAKSSLLRIKPVLFTYVPSLVYLDMDGNMLSEINDEFSSLSNLETLLISSNKLSSIAEGAFENLGSLERLEFYDNQLNVIHQKWFENLVGNNGTLKLSIESKPTNPWNCCAVATLKYKEFADSLVPDLRSREQYDIQCASPQRFLLSRIEEVSKHLLENACLNVTNLTTQSTSVFASGSSATAVNGTSNTSNGMSSLTAKTTLSNIAKKRGNETGGLKFEIVCVGNTNMFSHLADGHIVLILLTVVVLVAACTAVTVRYYYVRQKWKSFDNFMENVPKSKHEESDDDLALTTRTYRQNAPVYGSTGQIVDRHKNGMASVCSTEGTSSEEVGSPLSRVRRKPPPYESSTSSGPEDQVFDGTFSTAQFNNSSSVRRGFYERRKRSGAFTNYGYESDISDDVWNMENVK